MKKSIVFLVAFAGLSLIGFTQDNLGIAGSTHAPANTVWNNPSTIVDSRAFIDFNLVGVSVFARNNFAYYAGGSFSPGNISGAGLPSFNRKAAPYNAYVNAQVQGPSVTFAIKQHAFGIQTRFRTVADVRGIPESFGYYMTEGFQYRDQMGMQQTVKNARANALSWLEAGISYGTIISRSGGMITQGAVSVRRLIGVAGVGMRVDNWNYTVMDSTNMVTSKFQGEYGFNDPGMEQPSVNNGGGWGVDLGITFKQRLSESSSYKPHDPCTDGDYRYRLGFSALDLGAVKFKGPFYRNVLDQSESAQWNDFSNTNADEISDLDSLLNSGLGAARDNSDKQRFVMMLPAALSAQFDYNFNHGFYVHTVLTGGLPWKNRLGVQRASYLGVIPRWEKKRFEVAMPISLYEFTKPQVGLMFRLNSIVIGSDNLGWLLFKQDMYGADIYFNLKYTIFKHWKCGEKKEKKEKPKKEEKLLAKPCPNW